MVANHPKYPPPPNPHRRNADPIAKAKKKYGELFWNTYDGGPMPVHWSEIIQVIFRNGEAHQYTAGGFLWSNTGGEKDIVEYRKVSDIFAELDRKKDDQIAAPNCVADPLPEYTGGSVSYYTAHVAKPTNPDRAPYDAECNDIIEALGMNYAEGNAFKAIWRSCAARNLGKSKAGYKDGLYDAEKVVFFGQRMVEQAKQMEGDK